MQDQSSESNSINEPEHKSPIYYLYLIKSWLNKYSRNKLEYYSVIFGISGVSFIILGICILIIIYTIYEYDSRNIINCSIINITHTHIKLCQSYRCQILNYCIPYVCTIIFVRYYYNNISYESKLFSSNILSNSSCSYEPSFCTSYSHIQFEQIIFLKKFLSNISQLNQCCLHSLTEQPKICNNYLNSIEYSISILLIILCCFIGFILILIGIIIQLHLNNYFKSDSKHEDNFLNTILNFRLSHGTIESSFDKTIPVNYDILTQTINQHNTSSTRRKSFN